MPRRRLSRQQNVYFKTLANFTGTNEGCDPITGLVQGTDGNLYGTTDWECAYRYGTVYRVTPSGQLTTLYSFCLQSNCPDGYWPNGLIRGVDGSLYGTTAGGGAYNNGTVFKITLSGTLTTLYSFCAQSGCPDGSEPETVVQANDGSFYGTTAVGGSGNCYAGCGTVFRMTPSGALTTLHSLDYSDGYDPNSLVQASDGNFYGTAYGAGAYGDGTVFKISPSGTFTALYSFCLLSECPDGDNPLGLVQASDGSFYGTTRAGGANCIWTGGCGTVFKITPSGTLTTIHSFDGTDGSNPLAGVIQAADGNFYGTTANTNGQPGSVFEITPAGVLTTLHSFNGTYPYAGLVQASDGSLYGTTYEGGAYGDGTVFRLGVVNTCATCRP